MPEVLLFEENQQRMENTYDAAGIKLQKRTYQNGALLSQTDYIGSILYQDQLPLHLNTPEGRYLISQQRYEYHLKDHLGNLRIAFRKGDTLHYQSSIETHEAPQHFPNLLANASTDQARTGLQSALLAPQTQLSLKTLSLQQKDQIQLQIHAYQPNTENNPNNQSPWNIQLQYQPIDPQTQNPENQTQTQQSNTLQIGINYQTQQNNQNPQSTQTAQIHIAYYRSQDSTLISQTTHTLQLSPEGWQSTELQFQAPQDGYAHISLENPQNLPLYIDDISLLHTQHLISQENHYYPFGMNTVGIEKKGQPNHQYQYNSKEKQEDFELGWLDYGARMYSPDVPRWWVVDPLAEKMRRHSPYNYCFNNPIRFIDPDGMKPLQNKTLPIFDRYGNLLGTTNTGLQGTAIIMDSKNFKQGMSDDEARLYNTNLYEGYNDNFSENYGDLSQRPDWDGVLNFAEVTIWSNEGSGLPLFVDANKLNLNSINTSVFYDKENSLSINFFGIFNDSKSNTYPHPETGLVYGHVQVTLLDEKTGKVLMGINGLLDEHNFDGNPITTGLNDILYLGKPADFKIYCAPCETTIRTEAASQRYWAEIFKVIAEKGKW